MIKAVNLTRKFGSLTAVDNLNIEIPPGEIFAFLGPNGAGKTTTVKLFTGILQPTAGSAVIGNFDLRKNPIEAKSITGFVSDQPYVYPHLTGFEFMRLVGDIYKVGIDEQKQRIPELLSMFELSPWAGEMIEAYSHGMKQKLVLASVLLHQPKVIFLDEPLVGLDPKSAKMVKEIITRLSAKGVAVFMCTHVLEIAERLAHRIGIIQNGRIIALGTVEELKKRARQEGTLEELFLHLTGGSRYSELLELL
ncbi:MAG TPA: ABC transporter [Elusimicrobia bacterium]|nr:MAG: ABC transporter [Elusimicrobia bacterium RIFOXYA12_FULL_49_49]OGS15833.1 MAG: ABC transporter [Elusimicrobia bacterium RIFOXYA2_FULL_47_53]OGS27127.1 MAG: ABC transporter [Elusimicrobia bacterium RIFOXYB12_FULL_50_12]OGS31165.1 MAG: ABC transporter [Elusimicrobia bacterium RIFOXYB2_FULL_46_23]HBU70169.1 ABC transporter [Elusimicrobiota bacterium]